MVSTKVIFTLCIVTVTILQIYGKPAVLPSNLINQVENSFKNFNIKVKDVMNSDKVDMVKKKLNTYTNELNNNIKSFSKTIENSELGKQANKQLTSAIEIYNHNVPATLSTQKVNERLENTWKSANEFFKKV
ncbi:uncharacterized protein LOC126894821 [Daktulosphaira vitifoliae]|uniref:uncharacterized protein LOC126894821 n=1 Tax=Daktulosphaira vitifoliae TaxID=58002 RepID=UPI0021AA39D4|nr:uncharacterized protein LOC126894821 [Daktulosphaira vitifoliae]